MEFNHTFYTLLALLAAGAIVCLIDRYNSRTRSFINHLIFQPMTIIKIEIPEGKIASQESKNGSIVITFKDKPKGNILERIKTFDDAFNEADEKTRQKYLKSIQGGNDSADDLARKKLKLIIKVINEGVVFDYSDTNQKKWYPWFQWVSGSGFVFSISYFDYSLTFTSVGVRLCFSTQEKCNYVAKQFNDLFNDFLT